MLQYINTHPSKILIVMVIRTDFEKEGGLSIHVILNGEKFVLENGFEFKEEETYLMSEEVADKKEGRNSRNYQIMLELMATKTAQKDKNQL
jgi:hypothetical protein